MVQCTFAFPRGMQVFERGWLSSNNVLLLGEENVALVDSGYANHAALTLDMVRNCIGGRQLRTLVNTHLHSDHCGGNATLQAAFPAVQTLIPPGLADAVRRWDDVALSYRPTGQACPRFHIDGVLPPGSTITLGANEWQVHAAPGHDRHSVIFFEPRTRTLISADALWENGFGVVFQELEGERAFDEVEKTLDLIDELAPAVVVPGHGSVFTGVGPAVDRARSRLDAYRSNPLKHAAHAAKVLLKFKLLDVQRLQTAALADWATATPYFRVVHGRWFADVPFQLWISQLLNDLVRVHAATRDADWIQNS
ncbi:MAG: fold metallo-hydrolase [Ramlibacter sp.]|jgi:glyoxylase-like metal-dependent hydrolase (beta-lactamase superfamily II)|uniref:MBL fold metallo-hydrolase n=1 Tax=Ramlibacter sp. TaxID=1917967 RepID=UPI00263465F0|nr:MBL fold metallo-hydrolase [Ramlibacter sp.]MDB5749825.1 fold metallo-hydrolase [Ramlibacter sp.]